jgi:uncharacterized membrane protein
MLSHPYLMALIGLVFVATIVSMGFGVGWDLSADVGGGRRHAPLWVMVFVGLPFSAAVMVAGVVRQVHLNRAARQQRAEAHALVSSPGRIVPGREARAGRDAPGRQTAEDRDVPGRQAPAGRAGARAASRSTVAPAAGRSARRAPAASDAAESPFAPGRAVALPSEPTRASSTRPS